MPDISSFTKGIGIDKWNLGMGQFGNLVLFTVLTLFVFVLILAGIIYIIYRRQYKYKIVIIGRVGNTIVEKEYDWAKEVPIGRAGDKWFYMSRRKKFLAFPMIQAGKNKYIYFEREDGELINVGYEDLNEKMRLLGFKFIDADMRMQRLGIEKNLQFRLQKEDFWSKYKDLIINAGFYAFLTILIIVIFYQMGKIANSLNVAIESAGELVREARGETIPQGMDGGSSGVVGALIFVGLNNWRYRKRE